MNRQDFNTVLGQVDNLGNTLLQNRVMEQQTGERQQERDWRQKMFTEQQATRADLNKQNAEWKNQNEDQQTLQMIIRANADGSFDDAARQRANEWITQHPALGKTGIQLSKPAEKSTGQFNTAPGHNLKILTDLRAQIRAAQNGGDTAGAQNLQQQLDDFMALTGKAPEAKAANDPSAKAVETARAAKTKAQLDGDAEAEARADSLLARLTPAQFQPVMGDVRRAEQQDTSAPGKPDHAAILAEAQQAIQKGADPVKVKARLKEKFGITLK